MIFYPNRGILKDNTHHEECARKHTGALRCITGTERRLENSFQNNYASD